METSCLLFRTVQASGWHDFLCKIRCTKKVRDLHRLVAGGMLCPMPAHLKCILLYRAEPAPVPPIPNEQQLARLTDYVAFLEN